MNVTLEKTSEVSAKLNVSIEENDYKDKVVEEQLMHLFWAHGPLFVKQLVELLPDPKPHFNTVSTFVRILEKKGFVSHNELGGHYTHPHNKRARGHHYDSGNI